MEIVPIPMNDILILPGETEAFLDVLAPADTGGRVEWLGAREGDTVKKGQLLAMIDVSARKAALERAETAYKLAQEIYERRKTLYERKILDRENLDRSLTERNLAQSSLKEAQVEHERGFVRSPITGMVNERFIDEGEFVERGKPVMDLVNVDSIKININVPELDIRYLRPGQKAGVTVDAFPERRFAGTVDFVAFKADPATKTFLVRVITPNPDHGIRPGMIARVRFLRRTVPNALVAPLFALVDKGGERLLFIVKDGIVHACAVTIGIIEGDRVQITKGLQAGDRLIVKGQTEVEDGMKVEVQ
jgi:membrane fusion protein (multidrug efflux system)